MKTYTGTKMINAQAMTRASYNAMRGWTLPADENGEDDGYLLVEYLDGGKPNHPDFEGYVSWSPRQQFEGAYIETSGLTFGLALEAMKKGQRVRRSGWNGKGLWLDYRPANGVDLAYIRMSYPVTGLADGPYPNGARAPWAPSQTDMLCDDWLIV